MNFIFSIAIKFAPSYIQFINYFGSRCFNQFYQYRFQCICNIRCIQVCYQNHETIFHPNMGKFEAHWIWNSFNKYRMGCIILFRVEREHGSLSNNTLLWRWTTHVSTGCWDTVPHNFKHCRVYLYWSLFLNILKRYSISNNDLNHETIFHPNMGKFEAPDSSCIILKLNKKICSIPFNKINGSQMEIFPWFSYWVNVLCYIVYTIFVEYSLTMWNGRGNWGTTFPSNITNWIKILHCETFYNSIQKTGFYQKQHFLIWDSQPSPRPFHMVKEYSTKMVYTI
jgi:hypothetical protein